MGGIILSKITELILMNRPYGYVTASQKKILEDFVNIRTNEMSANCYLYKNKSFYENLILHNCLRVTEENLESNNTSVLDHLKIGSIILYKNQSYIFKGKKDDGDTFVLELLRKKGSPVLNYVPKKQLEKNIKLIEKAKTRNAVDYRQTVSELIGLREYNYTNEKLEVIIAPKIILSKLWNDTIKFNKLPYHLGELCCGRYLNRNEKLESIPYTNNYEIPNIIFTSDILALSNKLLNNELPEDLCRINIMGLDIYKDKEKDNLIELIEITNSSNIQLNIFSDFSSFMNNNGIEVLKSLNVYKNWIADAPFESAYQIEYDFVSTNNEFKNYSSTLDSLINNLEDNYGYNWVKSRFFKIVNMIYGQSFGNSNALNEEIQDLRNWISNNEVENSNEILEFISSIYANRFGFQVKKTIDNSIERNQRIGIVVKDIFKFETQHVYKGCEVLALEEDIKESLYDRFDKIILVNPYSSQRRKWISSGICNNIIVLYPDILKQNIARALKLDKKYLNQIIQSGKEGLLVNKYIQKIEDTIETINNEYQNSQSEINELNWSVEEPELTENYYEIYKRHNSTDAQIYQNDDNTLVDINWGFTLSTGHHILATGFSRFLSINENKIIRKKSVEDLSLNDRLIFFEIPYSDAEYRDLLATKLNKPITILKEENYIINDFYWRKTLLNYINQKYIGPKGLKELFNQHGYTEKSKGFYSSWMKVSTMPILPRDKDFIKYVGIITGNSLLVEYYEQYYEASKLVKDKLAFNRHNIVDSIEGKTIDELETLKLNNFIEGNIVSKSFVEIKNVPRYLTNKVLGSGIING